MCLRPLSGLSIMAVVKLRTVPGMNGRTNDLLFIPSATDSDGAVFFFGGDVQDEEEIMLEHSDNRCHSARSLERTAVLLAEAAPKRHIIIVKPSLMELGTFSRYNNFLETDSMGSPVMPPAAADARGLRHLRQLLENLQKRLPLFRADCSKVLVGFSKGSVVLNQLLYEMADLTDVEEDHRFIASIEKMCWLDGGHSGGKNTWVTDQRVLEAFAKKGIAVDVRVTPYQINDRRRPWIQKEEKKFSEALKRLGVKLERQVFFSDQKTSLNNHFRVLDTLKTKPI